MSISPSGIGTRAPLGQTCMHFRPSHTTQGMTLGSMYGAPFPLLPVGSILMHWAGQTSTHLLQRLHVSRNCCSGRAPGGRSQMFSLTLPVAERDAAGDDSSVSFSNS